jgi:hypothetical protein
MQDTIDLTPTWRAVVSTLVNCAVNGTSYKAREVAMDQLLRLADFADMVNAKNKEEHAEAEGTEGLLR